MEKQLNNVNHLKLGGKSACGSTTGFSLIFPQQVNCPECLKIVRDLTYSQYPGKTIK